ncbi:DUF6463 family protein [Phytomonospora endophytica]|uniref:Uncharacterized protein n=1 Tax=Phytomonospora endophytica TaxID=714109 RepID=A0A841FVC9_9ACTN|nr:DUF6463 family protein [Phytomonospora endophytica]MBB6039734.1 hypothetical protein [Phytomonospora endophytica]GIG70930.1 hypothetical protein Pen01_72250 [Phytomonospora endophytica]
MRPPRKTIWSGAILMVLGALHLAMTFALSARHIPGWLGRGLWMSENPDLDISALPPEIGGFWFSFGSFGLPLILLGALVTHLGKRGQTAPALIGWVIGAWALLGAYLLEPSPFALAVIPAVMIVTAARAATPQSTAVPASAPTP